MSHVAYCESCRAVRGNCRHTSRVLYSLEEREKGVIALVARWEYNQDIDHYALLDRNQVEELLTQGMSILMRSPVSVYIGTGCANADNKEKLKAAIEGHGHTITYDWEVLDSPTESELRYTAVQEVQGVKDAQAFILLLPGGRGAHCELGVALASEVPTLLLGSEELISDGGYGYTSVFYHHPMVTTIIEEDPSAYANHALKWLRELSIEIPEDDLFH